MLIDGNRDQLRLITRAARKLGIEITIVLDIVHVLEYLWHAAYAFHSEGTDEAEDWVEHQFVKLLSGSSGGAIAKSLRLMIKSHGLDAATAKPVEKAAGYLVKNTRFLHYDRALIDGCRLPQSVRRSSSSWTCTSASSCAPESRRRSAIRFLSIWIRSCIGWQP